MCFYRLYLSCVIYVFMHACMHVRRYVVCMYACMYACTHACMHVHMYVVRAYARMHVCCIQGWGGQIVFTEIPRSNRNTLKLKQKLSVPTPDQKETVLTFSRAYPALKKAVPQYATHMKYL